MARLVPQIAYHNQLFSSLYLECTYIKPSNRRRNPTPQYIEALENQLQRAESLLKKYLPDIDLADPALNPTIQQEIRARQLARKQTSKPQAAHDKTIASMTGSIGNLDFNGPGNWNFQGPSSSTVFFLWIKKHFRGMLGLVLENEEDFQMRPRCLQTLAKSAVPNRSLENNGDSLTLAGKTYLPTKEVAHGLCYYYNLNSATCLIRILHMPSFYALLDQVYAAPFEAMASVTFRHSLAVVHSVFAVGYMYQTMDCASSTQSENLGFLKEGLRHYEICQALLQDADEHCSLKTLQAFIHMTLFLQMSSDMNRGYAFVGVALRMCIRMGLHRNIHDSSMSYIEIEERRRVFFLVRHLDIQISYMLGFPLLLNFDDVDQEPPREVDDDYILPDQILPQPLKTHPFFEAFNAHTRLMEIMGRITKHVYPINGAQKHGLDACPSVPCIVYEKVCEIEKDLQQWFEKLPMAWRPGFKGPIEMVRVQHVLRFTYAHVQLALYRPFLHYTSPRLTKGQDIEDAAYSYAAAAISVSRNIVQIGVEMQKQGVVIGPYWLKLFTELFATIVLVFYVSENPHKQDSAEILDDAYAGRDLVTKLVKQDMAAEGIGRALKRLFTCLSERLGTRQTQMPTPFSRKRPATSSGKHESGHVIDSGVSSSKTSPVQAQDIGVDMTRQQAAVLIAQLPEAKNCTPIGDLVPQTTSDPTTQTKRPIEPGPFVPLRSNTTGSAPDSLDFPPNGTFAYPAPPPIDLELARKIAAQAHDAADDPLIAAHDAYTYAYDYDYTGLGVDMDPQPTTQPHSHHMPPALPRFLTRHAGRAVAGPEMDLVGEFFGHVHDAGVTPTAGPDAAMAGVNPGLDVGVEMEAIVQADLLVEYAKAELETEGWSGFEGAFGGGRK
ncbi:uncharacterized protein BROUX77_004952 [Berkeleyomyces rouxiae]|uniref:uncharacterized protein n=1 Tax=Berkeleyomyces rouxiae TaxID=2035830 RepID=UPI003B76FBE0